jgi:hypothetical protein
VCAPWATSDVRTFEKSSPERTLWQWLVSPNPQEHVARFQTLFDAGATGVFLHAPQRDQTRVLATYRNHVLPALSP